MAKIEFEEKEYETALYRELRTAKNRLWSPGQVLEEVLGFDYSVYNKNPKFWKKLGVSRPKGLKLSTAYPAHPKITRPLPNFELNLFIQAKRPKAYRLKATATLAAAGLKSPHWRFNIKAAQQQRLLILSVLAGPKALVCYAAPAFHKALNLYSATLQNRIIEKSTFPTVTKLGPTHKAWNYSKSGAGVANVEPEAIVEESLQERISNLLRTTRQGDEADQVEADQVKVLARLWKAADQSSRHELEFLSARRQSKYLERQKKIMELKTLGDEKSEIMTHCLNLMNYSRTFSMTWLVISPIAKQEQKQA
ncbi:MULTISPECIES: hypothetical protein [Xanthomonas]|uniref:hypothetical protein n=1 Tax=Xanthomonas TaxID=338 RepID=UPI000E1E76E9|nr:MULTISPECIES: hypothetical protein [Xanthomonas]